MTDASKGLRVLYVNNSFHSEHGGRTHARAFHAAAQLSPKIRSIEVFPQRRRGGKAAQRPHLRRSWLPSLPPELQLLRFDTFGLRPLYSRLGRGGIDVVLVRTWTNVLLVPLLKLRFPDLPVVVEVNASPFDEYLRDARCQPRLRGLEGWCLSKADAAFFVSQALMDRYERYLDRGLNTRVIHNGVDPRAFQRSMPVVDAKKRLGLDTADFVVGYVGGMEAYRDVPRLIRAFQTATEGTRAVLIIVGDGADMERVSAQARAVDPSGARVRLLGRVPHTEVPRIVEALDLAVHHQAFDYMSPLKLFEYLAVGVAVVAPATLGVKEVLKDGVHAMLVEPSEPALARVIQTLMHSPESRESLAIQGRKLVLTSYTWTRNAERVIELMESAVASRNYSV